MSESPVAAGSTFLELVRRPSFLSALAIGLAAASPVGGEVTVESHPGRGSVFLVHLPSSRVLQRT